MMLEANAHQKSICRCDWALFFTIFGFDSDDKLMPFFLGIRKDLIGGVYICIDYADTHVFSYSPVQESSVFFYALVESGHIRIVFVWNLLPNVDIVGHSPFYLSLVTLFCLEVGCIQEFSY